MRRDRPPGCWAFSEAAIQRTAASAAGPRVPGGARATGRPPPPRPAVRRVARHPRCPALRARRAPRLRQSAACSADSASNSVRCLSASRWSATSASASLAFDAGLDEQPDGRAQHLEGLGEIRRCPLCRRGRVVELVRESGRHRPQRRESLAVLLHRGHPADDRPDLSHDAVEHGSVSEHELDERLPGRSRPPCLVHRPHPDRGVAAGQRRDRARPTSAPGADRRARAVRPSTTLASSVP